MSREEILKARDKRIAHLRGILGDDTETLLAEKRYGFISGLLREVLEKPAIEPLTPSDKIDKVVLNRWLSLPIFLALMLGLFQFVFTLSTPLMGWINQFFSWLAGYASVVSPDWLGSLLADGIIGGVGSVLTFVPPIFLLFLAISFLEDCGYMARGAFIMDRLMHRIRLHGRSFIPMVLGFGCNVPGIMACRTIEDPKDRMTTMLINPFMSCGARLPIYVLLAGTFFSAHQGLVVYSMYLIGILIATIVAFVFRHTILKGPSGHFVMELPPYRLPTLMGEVVHMWERGRPFLIKAGTVIFGIVVLIWLLGSLPWGVEYASADSIIGKVGSFIAPALAPAGFGQWQAAISLIFGSLAKEVVVGTMGTLLSAGQGILGGAIATQLGWTPLVAFSFMVFCLLSTPCVASLATIRSETNSWRWPIFTALYTITIAWVMATLIFQIGSLFL